MYADPVKKLQEEMYQQLVILREGLYQTIDVACASTGSTAAPVVAAQPPVAAPATNGAINSDEVKKLKEENTKLNYRVKILC